MLTLAHWFCDMGDLFKSLVASAINFLSQNKGANHI